MPVGWDSWNPGTSFPRVDNSFQRVQPRKSFYQIMSTMHIKKVFLETHSHHNISLCEQMINYLRGWGLYLFFHHFYLPLRTIWQGPPSFYWVMTLQDPFFPPYKWQNRLENRPFTESWVLKPLIHMSRLSKSYLQQLLPKS